VSVSQQQQKNKQQEQKNGLGSWRQHQRRRDQQHSTPPDPNRGMMRGWLFRYLLVRGRVVNCPTGRRAASGSG
jgi:hypothetical protein